MISWILATAIALTTPLGASSIPGRPDASAVSASVRENEVMAIPPELKLRLRSALGTQSFSDTLKMQRLMGFLIADDGLGMTYEAGATYTVGQAYVARKANCLTFTLMVVALAEEVGLKAYPQEEGETLLWQQIDGTVYRENHINAVIRVGAHQYTIDPTTDTVLLSQPPKLVNRARLLAHYYDNVAVDALQRGALSEALSSVQAALKVDPSYAPIWSNAGVMYLHEGDTSMARSAYERALSLDPFNASALFNMVQLLHGIKDDREGDYRARLAKVEQRDPIQQLLEGLDFERSGNLGQAIANVKHAIQLKSNEPRFYAILARLYERSGDVGQARSALWTAQSISSGPIRLRYEVERQRLGQLGKKN
ncbi:MAG: tetratricopeptide repeat protein [Luteimonas sp.]